MALSLDGKVIIILFAFAYGQLLAALACEIAMLTFDRHDRDVPPDNELDGYPGAGARIGYLERTVAFAAALFGVPSATAALLLVKTAARFGEASTNHRFAERFIIGTTLSLSIAVGAAVIARFVVGMDPVLVR